MVNRKERDQEERKVVVLFGKAYQLVEKKLGLVNVSFFLVCESSGRVVRRISSTMRTAQSEPS